MRFVVLLLFATAVVAACNSTSSSSPGGALVDAAADGAPPDGATADGATDGAAASSDAGDAGEGGIVCRMNGGTYDKTCATASDCLMVAIGCYCGAQPIVGVANSVQPAAQACESQAAAHCALGCANAPGHVGEDGQNDEGTGKNLEVHCDDAKCHTVLGP